MTDGRASGKQYGLEDVAEFTADRAVSVSAIVPMPAVALANRLRMGYAVTFVMPTSDSRRHRLEIGVATRRLQVRAPFVFRTAFRSVRLVTMLR